MAVAPVPKGAPSPRPKASSITATRTARLNAPGGGSTLKKPQHMADGPMTNGAQ